MQNSITFKNRRERMKTPEQIKEWLERQPWYEQYKTNLFQQSDSSLESRECLSGQAGLHTISGAFCWQITEEGFDFWNDVDRKFMDWFEDVED